MNVNLWKAETEKEERQVFDALIQQKKSALRTYSYFMRSVGNVAAEPLQVLRLAFWFMENVNAETPGQEDMYFALRSKIRETL